MSPFNDKKLLKFYGSWVKVQVAFYDFIFQYALDLCPEHFRESAIESALSGEFADGEDFYEVSVKTIETNLSTFEEAWLKFKSKEEAENE